VLTRVALDSAALFSSQELAFLKNHSAGIWSLTSPDGEGGHAGTVECEIAIVVLGSTLPGKVGEVIIVYRAKVTDKPSTALNLTHHWGFNLGASAIAKGRPTPARDIGVQDHVLTLKADEILNIDPKTSRPTGTTLPLSRVAVKDFRNGKTIGKVGDGYPEGTGELGQGSPADGYCDYWIFDRQAKSITMDKASKDSSNVFEDIARE
jgi:aldose 1-epimerase